MTYKSGNYFWAYRSNITNVVIENNLNSKTNASYTFDVSEKQDGSVMAYLVANESDTSKYTLYLQGENGILANPNSSSLFAFFSNLTTIDGIEYLDTSNVTSMHNMFYGCSSLTSLDLSHFDTSNVTNMGPMFYNLPSTTIVKVRNTEEQTKILNLSTSYRPSSWTTNNVVVAS